MIPRQNHVEFEIAYEYVKKRKPQEVSSLLQEGRVLAVNRCQRKPMRRNSNEFRFSRVPRSAVVRPLCFFSQSDRNSSSNAVRNPRPLAIA